MSTDFADLPRLFYRGSLLVPSRQSYRVQNPFGVRISNISGGFSRSASEHLGGASIIQAEYTLRDTAMLQFFQDFYYGTLLEGALTFRANLSVNNAELEEIACKIVAPVNFPQFAGFNATVTLNLEALPVIDYALSSARALLSEVTDATPNELIFALGQLATVQTENSIGRVNQ